MAQYATVYTRSWAANSLNARVRLKAENDRLRQEVLLLSEEIRIKNARMMRIDPHKRPHYPPAVRMAILELRAARGWSQQQTADAFQLTAATIAAWKKRLDEDGPDALVQLREPVNKFPDFVRYVAQRLKALCPQMGKVKIAQTLARAGVHLAPSTVGNILREPTRPKPKSKKSNTRIVTAKYTNHVWHLDLTTVAIGPGFWVPWSPCSLPQCWPFCWWILVAVDHYSRRVMALTAFEKAPTSLQIRTMLGRVIAKPGAAPKYIITDKGKQFWKCGGYTAWCRRHGITPRFGAIGRHGSIAVAERFIKTLKTEGTRRIWIPLKRKAFQHELNLLAAWFNKHRPHSTLDGCTPDERYHGQRPANK